jgi:NADP-dependent 3-hydroxy acid dehydrogenase YdfG
MSGLAKQAASSIQAQLPWGGTYALELDITNQSSILNAVKEVGSLFDHFDVLTNNAGIQPTSSGLPSQLCRCLEPTQ